MDISGAMNCSLYEDFSLTFAPWALAAPGPPSGVGPSWTPNTLTFSLILCFVILVMVLSSPEGSVTEPTPNPGAAASTLSEPEIVVSFYGGRGDDLEEKKRDAKIYKFSLLTDNSLDSGG